MQVRACDGFVCWITCLAELGTDQEVEKWMF